MAHDSWLVKGMQTQPKDTNMGMYEWIQWGMGIGIDSTETDVEGFSKGSRGVSANQLYGYGSIITNYPSIQGTKSKGA